MSDNIKKIAEFCHDQWIHWMKYMCDMIEKVWESCSYIYEVNSIAFERWQKQMKTPYSKLTEKEKESDREQARKFIKLMEGLE